MAFTLRFLILSLLLVSFALETPTVPVPARDSFVTDANNLLDGKARAELTQRLQAIYDRTGARINILIVNTTGGESVEKFAQRAVHSWKMVPDEMLLLVALRDQTVKFEIGDRLREIFTDSWVAWYIQRELLPAFKSGEITPSLSWTVAGMDGQLKDSRENNASSPAFVQDFSVGKALIFLFLLVLCLAGMKFTNTLAWLTFMPFPLALVLLGLSHFYPWLDPFVVYSILTPFIIFAVLVVRCLVIVMIYKALGRPRPYFNHFPFGKTYRLQSSSATYIEPGFHHYDSHSHSYSHDHSYSSSDSHSHCSSSSDSSDSCSDSGSGGDSSSD